MKIRIITVCFTLMAGHLFLPQLCWASSFFEMTLERDSIYTPGKMNMTMKLTNKVKVEGDYEFQVSIYAADTLVRKQILPATKKMPAAFELAFPEAHSKTHVRCRVELFINGQFIEAEERPLILWPSSEPYAKKLRGKVIWTFDISGRLQEIFDDLEVETTDATFQAARNFGIPDIVFIGQQLDCNSMQVIVDRLASADSKPVTVFLRQTQLPKNCNIKIPGENNRSINVACDLDSPLLQGLNQLDVMYMVDDAIHIKIKKQKDIDWTVDSYVSEILKDEENIYSYLTSIQEKGQITIYCQLPVTDGDDPRYGVLFDNLLKFANKVSDSQKN